jgi:hypothetical protein
MNGMAREVSSAVNWLVIAEMLGDEFIVTVNAREKGLLTGCPSLTVTVTVAEPFNPVGCKASPAVLAPFEYSSDEIATTLESDDTAVSVRVSISFEVPVLMPVNWTR